MAKAWLKYYCWINFPIHQVIRGWLARVFHKVEGEEVEVTNFCFDTIQASEQDDLPRSSFVATRDMVGSFCLSLSLS